MKNRLVMESISLSAISILSLALAV